MKRILLAALATTALGSASASAADLPQRPVYKAAPLMVAPAPAWTGFYVGGNIGYGWGTGAANYNDPALGGSGLPTSFSGANNLDGIIGGVQVGYNWQLNNSWVTGLETDFQSADQRASRSFGPFSESEGAFSATLNSKIEWFGTVRGRLGWLVNPTTMVYATGGLAYGRVNASGSFTDTFCTPACMWGFNQSSTKVGWTVGGGIEGAVPWTTWNLPNWTWKVEYLYVNLGSISGSGFDTDFGGPYTWNAKFTDNILRIGVNYHFH